MRISGLHPTRALACLSHPGATVVLVRVPPGHPNYCRWAVNHGEPAGPQHVVDPPAPALADVELYDGAHEVLEVHVLARARGGVHPPGRPRAQTVARVGGRRARSATVRGVRRRTTLDGCPARRRTADVQVGGGGRRGR